MKYTDEIIQLAEQAGLTDNGFTPSGDYTEEICKFFRLAYARGMLQRDKQLMQLFLDPENQPTQFGTATEEYREKEVKEVQDLLTLIAGIVRTTHLYGPDMKKLLDQEEALRTRGTI